MTEDRGEDPRHEEPTGASAPEDAPADAGPPALAPEVVRPPAIRATEVVPIAPAVVRPPPLLAPVRQPRGGAAPAPAAAESTNTASPAAAAPDTSRLAAEVDRLDRLVHLTAEAVAAHLRLVALLRLHVEAEPVPASAPRPAPVASSPTPAVASTAPAPVAAAATPATPGRAVLVVDGAEAVRELERSILERAGYAVRSAADGREALELAAIAHPDLLVTDVELPHVNGLEVLATLRATPGMASLPVLVVTSQAREEDRRRALAAGASGYLVKQEFDERRLLEAVGRLVGAP